MNQPFVSKRKTKIICTLGPSVSSPAQIKALMLAGMDVARINCSHGKPENRLELAHHVRKVAAELGFQIPIMFDLQGPKIRIGQMKQPVMLVDGESLLITVGDGIGDEREVFTEYQYFARDVKPGNIVAIDDGKLRLKVERVSGQTVECLIECGGPLSQRKGINLPDTRISAPSLNDKDLADLEMAIKEGVDYLAVSFVRGAEDVVLARKHAARIGPHHLQFISKIERPEALKDLIPIINTSDGVMVARDDLGVEVGSHRVPMIQKDIITRANRAGKFVITATQMLDSMMERPIPTRAEASDVANAILDGTDACMLSGETASGKYPVESVKTMSMIALESESHSVFRYETPGFRPGNIHHIQDGISIAAYHSAASMGAQLLIAFTNSGSSALRLSKKHPDTLIVGATIHEHIARRMRAYWGVLPLMINKSETLEEMFDDVKMKIMELNLVEAGDIAILTAGYPMWTSGSTNLLKVMEI